MSIATILATATFVAFSPTLVTAQWSSDALSAPREHSVAATVGDLAIFAGGTADFYNGTDIVDIYDAATDSWSTATLSAPRANMGVAVLGDLVFFAGGVSTKGAPTSDVVDVFDTSTNMWTTASLSEPRMFAAGATVGNKVIFAGGQENDLFSGPLYSNAVDVYDATLGDPGDSAAWSVAQPLTQARTGLSAVTVGTLTLFAGGHNGTPLDTVDIYDATLGTPQDSAAWSTDKLSHAGPIPGGCATSVGSLAFFAGGQSSPSFPYGWSKVVDIYDASTGTWSTEMMSVARSELAVQVIGDTVLFAGGVTGAYEPTDIVDRYDVSTGQWGPVSHLSKPRTYMSSTTVGDKVMFAGGFAPPPQVFGTIDVFEPAPWTDLGGGTAGVAGEPWLNGAGSLAGGTSASVSLKSAPPSAFTLAWISLAPAPFAALGGTVHAYPFISQLGLFVNAEGSFNGTTTWPVGIPPGTEVWFQFLVQDGSTPSGITLSNGLHATAP